MTAPTSTPSSTPSRPNRAERRAAARGSSAADQAAEHAGVPAPRVTGQVHTKPRGGAVRAPRRSG